MSNLINDIYLLPTLSTGAAILASDKDSPYTITTLGELRPHYQELPICYEKEQVGILRANKSRSKPSITLEETAKRLAPIVWHWNERKNKTLLILKEIHQIKSAHSNVFDWVGLYFKSSYLLKTHHLTDLLLGPFLGPATDHVRIPMNRGICGMALREEKTINVADVRQRPEYLACSLKVRSEIVIPLKNEAGHYIAELDIDSDQVNAFDPNIEIELKKSCIRLEKLL